MQRLSLAIGLVIAMAIPAAAQTGGLSGLVTDDTGGVLPGATVVIDGPGGDRTLYADSSGRFSAAGLAPGTYSVAASLPGFATVTRSSLELSGAFILRDRLSRPSLASWARIRPAPSVKQTSTTWSACSRQPED